MLVNLNLEPNNNFIKENSKNNTLKKIIKDNNINNNIFKIIILKKVITLLPNLSKIKETFKVKAYKFSEINHPTQDSSTTKLKLRDILTQKPQKDRICHNLDISVTMPNKISEKFKKE